MRLWHVDLLPYLPNSQLLAQWRELNSIFKKQDKHILINYIYDHPKEYLFVYSMKVIAEMQQRGFKIKSMENFDQYFAGIKHVDQCLTYPEHDPIYLKICYFNLLEKHLCGQKDFTWDVWNKISDFMGEK